MPLDLDSFPSSAPKKSGFSPELQEFVDKHPAQYGEPKPMKVTTSELEEQPPSRIDLSSFPGKEVPQKEQVKPTEEYSSMKAIAGSAASLFDLALSAPGFTLQTATTLARTTLDAMEGHKDAFKHGRQVGEEAFGWMMNPLQKVAKGLGIPEEYYSKAPTSQLMKKVSDYLQMADKKAQEMGLPEGSILTMADAAMLAGVPGLKEGGAKALDVASKPSATDLKAEQLKRADLGYGKEPHPVDALLKPKEAKPVLEPKTKEQLAQEDRVKNAQETAHKLIQSGASKKQVEAIIKNNPEVGKQMDEIMKRRQEAIGAMKHTQQGEVLSPESPKTDIVPQKGMEPLVKGLGETKPALEDKSPGVIKAIGGVGGKQGGAVDPSVFIDAAKKAAKAGESIRDKAAEIYDKYGADAARIFIDNYQQEQGQKTLMEASKDATKSVEDTIRTRINDIHAKDRDIQNKANSVLRVLPGQASREKVATAIDSGDLSGLNPFEKQQAEVIKGHFKEIGTRAKEMGVIQGLRENYISHIVDWSKSGKTPTQAVISAILDSADGLERFSPKSKFGKERKYDTFEALEQAIKDAGLEVTTKDAAEIYKVYAKSMERAIENRRMIEQLKTIKSVDGVPVLQPIKDGRIPAGWKYLDSPQMRNYAVHPEIYPHLKFVFDNYNPGTIFKAVLGLSQAVKRLNVVGSLFHANSLVNALWSQSPTMAIKEIATGFGGTRRALEQFKSGGLGDSVDAAIKHGLVVEIPEDVSIGILQEIGKAGDSILSRIGAPAHLLEETGRLVNKVTLEPFNKITWEFLHTGLKLNTYLQRLEKAKLDHPDVPEDVLGREIARSVNDTFGGLNWYDVATQSSTKVGKEIALQAMSPKGRKWLQLALFAPDWTISTLRAFTTAFRNLGEKGKMKGMYKPSKVEDYARRYQLNTALTYLIALNGVNVALSGHFIWNNQDPTRIDLGDGTTMQPSKHAMEPYHWIMNPDKTISNKFGFWPKAIGTYVSGTEYFSPDAPKLQDTSALSRTKAALGSTMLPFQVGAAMQAPKKEQLKRLILSTLGFPTYGKTEQERKLENRLKQAEKNLARKQYRKQQEARKKRQKSDESFIKSLED